MRLPRTQVASPPPRSPFDLVECFYLAHTLAALEQVGVLKSLEKPVTLRKLAARHRVDTPVLEAALRMLRSRTNLLAYRTQEYRLTRRYDASVRLMLLQYLGAYRNNAIEFARILRYPYAASKLIDRAQHAKAFEQIDVFSANILADLLLQLELNHVLDIGCGAGTLLLNLAIRRPDFVGWGLDVNPWMCAAARKRIASKHATRRIAIFEGDCRNLQRALPSSVIAKVRTITSASLINEFFSGGPDKAVAWLGDVKAIFPGRTMLIADYCGEQGARTKRGSPEIALHDFIQIISGQGVPPGNRTLWKNIYKRAHCDLVHSLEFRDSPFFIHILRL
jgi:SAM-dependent methyltransferase